MQLTIRSAQLSDAEAMVQLNEQLGYSSTIPQIKHRLTQVLNNSEHVIYVAEIHNTLAGWIHACYTHRIESGDFIEIGGLVVDNQHRRKGIATQLIVQVKSWADSTNYAGKIRVRCNTKRTESHEFYRKIGFTEVKEQKVFELS